MLSEREKLSYRLKFEEALSKFFCKMYCRGELRGTSYLLKESPSLLEGFIKRFENEFENVLLSEQKSKEESINRMIFPEEA